MSLNKSSELRQVSRVRCRELRKKQTTSEQQLWKVLRNRSFLGLKFNRQFPIFYEHDGRESFFIADFHCHELRLVIELDGAIHRTQVEKDALRDEILQRYGYTVLHFDNNVVFEDLNKVLRAIQMLKDG
jgi:very-short-patch-repair endonuclease